MKHKITRGIYIIIATLFICSPSFSQDVYENKQVGIKAVKPQHWILATNGDVQNSLDKLKFTEEALQKIINSNNGTLTLCTLAKYHIDSVSGLIPTIKVIIRENPAADMGEFKEMMTESTNRAKTVVKNFEFIDDFKEITISGIPSLFYSCRYSLTLADGEQMNIRARYYMIPKNGHFISISLMDNEDNENCSLVFDQFISALELTK